MSDETYSLLSEALLHGLALRALSNPEGRPRAILWHAANAEEEGPYLEADCS